MQMDDVKNMPLINDENKLLLCSMSSPVSCPPWKLCVCSISLYSPANLFKKQPKHARHQ